MKPPTTLCQPRKTASSIRSGDPGIGCLVLVLIPALLPEIRPVLLSILLAFDIVLIRGLTKGSEETWKGLLAVPIESRPNTLTLNS